MSCQHECFEAYVEVTRVVSDQDKRVTLGFVVDVRARCASCQQELEFIGLPVGISSFGPTCSPDGVEARLNAKLKEVQARTSAYSAKVDGWRAASMATTADNELQSRWTDMVARTSLAFSEAQRGMYQANIQKAQSEAQILMEGAKARGQYAAQLMAGALSALNVSASVQGTGSQTDGSTWNTSTSTDTNYNYNY